MNEAYVIGNAKKINFSFDDPVADVTAFGETMPAAKPSMLQDHYAKRHSEIDTINAMVSELGRQLRIKTPYNDTVVAAVRVQESDFG